jgi:hypothetical protein
VLEAELLALLSESLCALGMVARYLLNCGLSAPQDWSGYMAEGEKNQFRSSCVCRSELIFRQ